MKPALVVLCVVALGPAAHSMYLDKANHELVLKIVYASDGSAALDQVTALADSAKQGLATPVVPRMGGTVRAFTLHLDPSIGVIRGFAPRVEVVGVSLDGLRGVLGPADADAMEKTILKGDGLVFVAAGAELGRTYDRVRGELAAVGTEGARTPVVILTHGTGGRMLAVKDMPVATGSSDALRALVKPIFHELLRRLRESTP
jgi:hypothetical protein